MDVLARLALNAPIGLWLIGEDNDFAYDTPHSGDARLADTPFPPYATVICRLQYVTLRLSIAVPCCNLRQATREHCP